MSRVHFRQSVTFRDLLLSVLSLFRVRLTTVAVSVLFFSLVSAVGTTFVNERIHRLEQQISEEAGIPQSRLLEDVTAKLRELREEDLLVFALAAQSALVGTSTVDPKENIALAYVVRVNPFVLGLFAFDLLVIFGAWVYFLILFSHPDAGGAEVAWRFPLQLIRTGILVLWLFVRSLLWIPLLGPVIALYMGPRLSLAPAVLVRGEAGILQSPRVSLRRTKHQWTRIFLWLVGLLFLSFFLLWIGLILGGAIAVLSAKMGFFLWILSVMAAAALVAGFLTVMTVATQ